MRLQFAHRLVKTEAHAQVQTLAPVLLVTPTAPVLRQYVQQVVSMEVLASLQKPVHATVVGRLEIVQHQFAHRLVKMAEHAQLLTHVPVRLVGQVLLVAHPFVLKRVKTVEPARHQILVLVPCTGLEPPANNQFVTRFAKMEEIALLPTLVHVQLPSMAAFAPIASLVGPDRLAMFQHALPIVTMEDLVQPQMFAIALTIGLDPRVPIALLVGLVLIATLQFVHWAVPMGAPVWNLTFANVTKFLGLAPPFSALFQFAHLNVEKVGLAHRPMSVPVPIIGMELFVTKHCAMTRVQMEENVSNQTLASVQLALPDFVVVKRIEHIYKLNHSLFCF